MWSSRPWLACGLAALSLASCTSVSSETPYFGKVDPPAGQHLRYISGSEPESLDPQMSSGQPEARIHIALFDGLTEFDPKLGTPIPSLATSWDTRDNNADFVFHLRRDAKWSNGRPLTAHDFVYSYRRGLAPTLASRNAYLAYYIQYAQGYNEGGVFARDPETGAYVPDPQHPDQRMTLPGDEASRNKMLADPAYGAARGKTFEPVKAEDIGVEALDDYTLHIKLTQSVPFFAGLVTHQFFRPVPREAVDAYGQAWSRPEHIITSGAFHLKVWKPYDRLIVARSPTFWDAANVRLDDITFYPLEEQTTMMNLYKAGEVDAFLNHTVPAAWIDRIRGKRDYMDKAENANEYYQINITRAPMNDVRVRKAFNMAIDKVALAKYRRVTKPLTSFVPEGVFPGYERPTGDPFDPARAKALLVEAGYANAAGQYDPSKFPVSEVELSYNTQESNRQVAEYVQAQWKQNLGLTIPLKNMEWKTFLDTRAKLEYKGLARSGWVGDYIDPFTFLAIFSTPDGDNGTGWFDKKYVAMLNASNREIDPQKRYAIMAQAEAYLLEAQPVIPLMSNATNWMKKPYVKGLYPNPVTLHAWKFVYIEHDPAKWGDDAPAPLSH